MKIAGFVRDDGGCGYYRVRLPLNTLKANGIETSFIEKGDNANKIHQNIMDADVFVIPRPSEKEMIDFLPTARAYGKKIVVEFDDNLFAVSPLSQHYHEWGTEEFNIRMPDGSKKELWKDGHTFDLKANRARIDNIKRVVSEADALQVTTRELGEAYADLQENIYALPNCVDTKLWKKLKIKRDTDEIRLFWSGGASHYEDWVILQDVLPVLFNTYDNLKLVILGTKFDGTLKGIPKEKIEFHNWVPTPAYPYKSAILDADIGIIPLQATEFNYGKSAIKWIEQGALSVPCVTSAVTPYIQMDEGKNGIFIENNAPDGWLKGISMLIEDQMLRWQMGGDALSSVKRKHDINTQWVQWEEAYRKVIDG